jgi:hypothetical protein
MRVTGEGGLDSSLVKAVSLVKGLGKIRLRGLER